ncbi:MAG: trehalase family glycosidase [Bacteroidota bacterium]
MKHLLGPAEKILDLNWRDGFTIPASRLYPFQWNWDSGFVSIGHSYFSLERAMKELDSLFSGQWENGMVPHIIFHSENETTYFPNYDFWEVHVNKGAPDKPKSSGITQPAVHGFVLEELLKKFPDNDDLLAFAKAIYPKIVHYHEFLYTYRDPFQEGLFFIYHPWESGRDNSPLWDESLDRIEVDKARLPNYHRRDNQIADSSERPTNDQYDKYVYLIEFGKANQYDGKAIAEQSPFLIQDSMMNAILIKSNESLIKLGKRFGEDTQKLQQWQALSIQSFNEKLWNEELNTYVPYDLRAKKQVAFWEIGGISSLYAGIPDEKRASSMVAYLENLHKRGYYLCPSFDVDSPLFDSKRYWRGPVWPQMNWMIAKGLKTYGYDELSMIVKQDILELVNKLGFYEYFESQKSLVNQIDRGYGGELFSWTASSVIDIIHES